LETEKDKARYIKFNTASIETGLGFKSCKRLSGGTYKIWSYLAAHRDFLRAILDAYGDGILVL